jgi:hypothetical protein
VEAVSIGRWRERHVGGLGHREPDLWAVARGKDENLRLTGGTPAATCRTGPTRSRSGIARRSTAGSAEYSTTSTGDFTSPRVGWRSRNASDHNDRAQSGGVLERSFAEIHTPCDSPACSPTGVADTPGTEKTLCASVYGLFVGRRVTLSFRRRDRL